MNKRQRRKRNRQYSIDKATRQTVRAYCLLYPKWQREHASLIGLQSRSGDHGGSGRTDPTASQAIRAAHLGEKIFQLEDAVRTVAPEIYKELLLGVTRSGMTFDVLKRNKGIPCERDYYYQKRREFYELMSARLGL